MSNNQITQTVSSFVPSQIPEFLRSGSPDFVAFLQAYYEWMEQGNNAVTTNSLKLLSYKDIDTTTDQFIQFFINDFLPYFPNEMALDERKLIKVARDFYQKKGSIESIKFLFRILYNKEVDILFPADNILRVSAGKWILPQALTLVVEASDQNFDVSKLVGRQGVGSLSNTTCVIESATLAVDVGLGIEVLEVFISNITGTFTDLENLNVIYGFAGNGSPLIFSEKIIAALSAVEVDPNNRGLKYRGTSNSYSGDPVVISGGLQQGDLLASKARGFVGNVTSGSVTGVIVNFGGYAYRITPNTQVKVINAPGDTTGNGANVIVQSIDSPNSIFVLINTDAIVLKAQTQISSANYAFANIALANQNTQIGKAFSYANLQFAPITSMNVINGGGAYTQTPSLSTQVTYYTDWTTQLALIPDPADAANTIQFIDDLGFIANVAVIGGGTGYNPATDVIVVPSGVGYGANFSFTVSGSGAITGVTVNNSGQGYFYLPYNLAVANSANTQNAAAGSGAVLTAYGFGQGIQLGLTVNKIGQILDVRLVSHGFDYVSTPKVSLRIEDLLIIDTGHNLAFTTDSVAFQGANINAASYAANIDSYNVSTSTIRLYDYQGSFNASQNLVTTTGNVRANINVSNYLTVYGDGKAKANAIFLNGLINFPGFFLDTSGFLSADQFLQDNDTYHAYAYIVQVEQALNDYKKTLMQLVHPTGTTMLGRYVVQQTDARNITANAPVCILPVVSGSVNANAFSPTGLLVGTGTQFTTNAAIGDLVVFNPSDSTRKLQVKQITAIANAGNLTMESNTLFIFSQPVVVNTSSNVIVGTNLFGNVAVNDILVMNVAGNVQTAIVQTTTSGSLTVNTVFNANATLMLDVYPSLNAASYKIIKSGT